MSFRSKEYSIPIKPIPWTRAGLNDKRFFDRQVQEKLAYGLYIAKQHGNDPIYDGPLEVAITFHMKQNILVKNRPAHGFHCNRPDLDNLIKLVLDSINGIGSVWHDDAQVSRLICEKVFNKQPKLIITIKELS
jgi:Holliday junction resolvase RusA-like endonuclease